MRLPLTIDELGGVRAGTRFRPPPPLPLRLPARQRAISPNRKSQIVVSWGYSEAFLRGLRSPRARERSNRSMPNGVEAAPHSSLTLRSSRTENRTE